MSFSAPRAREVGNDGEGADLLLDVAAGAPRLTQKRSLPEAHEAEDDVARLRAALVYRRAHVRIDEHVGAPPEPYRRQAKARVVAGLEERHLDHASALGPRRRRRVDDAALPTVRRRIPRRVRVTREQRIERLHGRSNLVARLDLGRGAEREADGGTIHQVVPVISAAGSEWVEANRVVH